MKHLLPVLLLLVTTVLSACGDSTSDFEKAQQEHAASAGDELLSQFNTAIAYAQRVTEILEQVTDDASAEQAIQQIDALGQEREAFNQARRAAILTGTDDQLGRLSQAKQELDQSIAALEQEITRIVFSGEGNTAIPKTGPMREVTRAVRVPKPERRR